MALFFWLLLGDFAFAMRERSAHQVVQLAMKSYGASSTLQSLVLVFLPHAVALVLQPIIAYKSDRYRSRWGRRIPFLLWTTPLTFFSMMGLAFCPVLASWTHRAFEGLGGTLSSITEQSMMLVYFAGFYFLFELACITSLTLFGALVNDVVPRNIIGRFYGAFRGVSLGAGMIFSSLLLRHVETHFTAVFLGIGITFGVGFMLMCLFVKEGEYPPPLEDDGRDVRGKGFFVAAETYFRECFHLSYYRWVFAAMLLAGLTFAPFNNFRIVYAKSVGVDIGLYGNIEATSFALSFLLAYPLGMLVDRFHPLRMGLIAMCLYLFSTLFGTFFIVGQATFLAAFMSHTILSGVYFTSTAALGALLFPKIRFGQFSSASAVIGHLGAMALSVFQGPLLDRTGNNYQLTWIMGMILCLGTIACLIVVYRKIQAFGGLRKYEAPA